MTARRVPQRYVVRIVGDDGSLRFDQADSLTQARQAKASIEKHNPGTKVNYYKSESGLAIFDGWMGEMFR